MFTLDDGVYALDFEKKEDFRKAEFFLGKSHLLFALSIDYPGFRKIPMAYLAAVRDDLKVLGFQVERGKLNNPFHTYRIFYYGPKPNRSYFGTPKYNATSFKIHFYGFPEGNSVTK